MVVLRLYESLATNVVDLSSWVSFYICIDVSHICIVCATIAIGGVGGCLARGIGD